MCRSCASSACDTHTHTRAHRSNGICHLSARPVQRAALQTVGRRVAPTRFGNAAPRRAARRGVAARFINRSTARRCSESAAARSGASAFAPRLRAVVASLRAHRKYPHTHKQTNKQTNKHKQTNTNKQTQTNKQTNETVPPAEHAAAMTRPPARLRVERESRRRCGKGRAQS
jgi:hypothetical protein